MNETAHAHVWAYYVAGSDAVEAAGTRSTINEVVVDILLTASRFTDGVM